MSKDQRDALLRADHRILLNVVVNDVSGKPVSGLGQDDFTLFDHHEPRAISSFQVVNGNSTTGRAHILLLIDSLNNSFEEVAQQRRAVERYLLQDGELPYPTSLVLLSDKGLRRIDPSKDGTLLATKLREKFPSPGRFSFNGGPSGGNQRFLLSLQSLQTLLSEERDVPGRAILIWMGRGWPVLMDRGYEAATVNDKKSYFDTLVNVSTLVREAQVTIDNIAPPSSNQTDQGDDRPDHNLLRGARSYSDIEARNLALPLIAYQSGGRLITQGKDVIAQIAQCVSDAIVYYRVSFDPDASSKPNELRSIDISVSKPTLTPRTNALYYSQP